MILENGQRVRASYRAAREREGKMGGSSPPWRSGGSLPLWPSGGRRAFSRFFSALLSGAAPEDAFVQRRAVAGMIWNRQFYQYNVGKWLDGDEIDPPGTRRSGKNSRWPHLDAGDVLSVPDKWEYPWFAARDLACHCMAFARFDVDGHVRAEHQVHGP